MRRLSRRQHGGGGEEGRRGGGEEEEGTRGRGGGEEGRRRRGGGEEEGCLGGSAVSDRLRTDEVVQRAAETATFDPHHQQEAE